MGNRKNGKRQPSQPPLQHFNGIPFRWLTCPNNGQAIHVESKPNLYFIPMKTPLPESYAAALAPTLPWTPHKSVIKARDLVPTVQDPIFHAINVAGQHEIIFKEMWEKEGVKYSRVPISKEYNTESLDAFCDCVNQVLEEEKDKTCVFLVYCGCGLNRVGFCISGYLAKYCSIPLLDAFKKCDESSSRLIYIQKPIDKLCSLCGVDSFPHGQAPNWVIDEKIGAVGEIPLPLEKYNAIKKVSKKKISQDDKNEIPREEIFKLLAEAVDDPEVAEGIFPKFKTTQWNHQSLNDLRRSPHFVTFEPRGIKAFIVVTDDDHIYVIDAHCNVTEVNAKSKCHCPAVASCILIEEKKRAVFLTTDLLLLGQLKVASLPLFDRLSYLENSFTKKLKPEINDQYQLQFTFRPMSQLCNSSRLRKGIANLFAKCEGLSFYNCEGSPGESLFLPIFPSVVLQFDYNGNDKAILYARGTEKDSLEPVGIYRSPNPKFNALDGRTNRFEWDREKHEWIPVAIGHNDPPTTVKDVNAMINFKQTNISYDDIFQDLDKIVYE